MTDWTRYSRANTKPTSATITAIVTAVGCLLLGFSLTALADGSKAPARSGEVGLTGPHSLHQEPLAGNLADADAIDLSEYGGALLVSGTASSGTCELSFSVGNSNHRFTLDAEPSVVHVELFDVRTGSNWVLSTHDCRARLEGALLFVGSAAAYIGDNPGAWWASARETLSPGIQ